MSLFTAKITTCHLIQYPTGRWGFAGKVPAALSFSNSPEEIERLRICPQFLKTRAWETKEAAIESAFEFKDLVPFFYRNEPIFEEATA